MKRFENLLVYVDSASAEDAALSRASLLAQKNRARLTVVDVAAPAPSYLSQLLPSQWTASEVVAEAIEERLTRLAAPHREAGLQVDVKVLEGAPAQSITREVLRHGHDLVFKTARRDHIDQSAYFGTSAQRLLRMCPCPVWIVQPRPEETFSQILAAIDLEGADQPLLTLSDVLLEFAISIAESEGAELQVLHGWDVWMEDFLARRMSADEGRELVRSAEAYERRRLQQFAAKHAGEIAPERLHLVRGSTSAVIERFVREHKVDLVVLGTVARSGVAGYIIGNEVERVLPRLPCSILAVKPVDFVSPVTL